MSNKSENRNHKYLLENGWESTGGVIPFWRHPTLSLNRLTYLDHALHYQRESEQPKETTNDADNSNRRNIDV